MIRRLIRAALRRLRPAPPGPPREYRAAWLEDSGRAYRMAVYERQKRDGTRPLTDNPTLGEIRAELDRDGVRSVLEIGCGWGRLLEWLQPHYDIAGCDVSPDMLALCPPHLTTFRYDVAADEGGFSLANAGRWDALITRGVMLYFIADRAQTARVMATMERLARVRVHVWEWPDVCAAMQAAHPSAKFAYHPMLRKDE